MTYRNMVSALTLAALLGACAGRDPLPPTPVAQPQDSGQNCQALHAEMQANSQRIQSLSAEEGNKRGANIAIGVVGGLLFWPALFAMDFKDAAGTDRKNMEARQSYLMQLYSQKSCAAPATADGWGRT